MSSPRDESAWSGKECVGCEVTHQLDMSSSGCQTYEYGDVNLDLSSAVIPSFLDIE
jgi:hypothetical protein